MQCFEIPVELRETAAAQESAAKLQDILFL
jgi:hypothetical protein